jgi:serine-threonine kinase receptor-associated protein
MPCNVESASLEPKLGNKFVAGGEDMWIHVFDFHTGEQIGMCNCYGFYLGKKINI